MLYQSCDGLRLAALHRGSQRGVEPCQAEQRFFKQKTAYGFLRSDWSSDVCSSD
eukprot:COSAG05_NODE_23923_length_255_cov_0.480769_1_plen_53_part_01